ncbi:hypothetical protein YC2023_015609 [Brassica napus]
MASAMATWTPSSLQLRIALNCRSFKAAPARAKLTKLRIIQWDQILEHYSNNIAKPMTTKKLMTDKCRIGHRLDNGKDSPERSSREKVENAGRRERSPERKKREMGKKMRFEFIKPWVRRIFSVGIPSVFSISIFAKYLVACLPG